MPRLMSVALTEQAVVERRKTVTRRLGWLHAKPGMRITLCRKVMGRWRADKTIEPLVRLAEVEVVDVRREPLADLWLHSEDTALEGFPDWSASQFIKFFCEHMRCEPETEVTRIAWRYLDEKVHGGR